MTVCTNSPAPSFCSSDSCFCPLRCNARTRDQPPWLLTGDDVIKGAGELDTRLAGHGGMIANAGQGVNNYRFMSDPLRDPLFRRFLVKA
jgi:hypothetical protein